MICRYFQQNLNFFSYEEIFLNFSKFFKKLEVLLRNGEYLTAKEQKRGSQNRRKMRKDDKNEK